MIIFPVFHLPAVDESLSQYMPLAFSLSVVFVRLILFTMFAFLVICELSKLSLSFTVMVIVCLDLSSVCAPPSLSCPSLRFVSLIFLLSQDCLSASWKCLSVSLSLDCLCFSLRCLSVFLLSPDCRRVSLPTPTEQQISHRSQFSQMSRAGHIFLFAL